MRRQLTEPRQSRPREEPAGQAGEEREEPGERPMAEETTLDDRTEQDGLDHKAHSRCDTDRHGRRKVAASDGHLPSQSGTDEAPRSVVGRSQLVPP